MFSKCFIICICVILMAFLSEIAYADGKFMGTVTYGDPSDDCDCAQPLDVVNIYSYSLNTTYKCGVDCYHDSYNTSGCIPSTFPPGQYKLWITSNDPDCDKSQIEIVLHGIGDSVVNLKVYAKEGPPGK